LIYAAPIHRARIAVAMIYGLAIGDDRLPDCPNCCDATTEAQNAVESPSVCRDDDDANVPAIVPLRERRAAAFLRISFNSINVRFTAEATEPPTQNVKQCHV